MHPDALVGSQGQHGGGEHGGSRDDRDPKREGRRGLIRSSRRIHAASRHRRTELHITRSCSHDQHGNRLIFNEIPTLGRQQIATTRDVEVCDVMAKIKLQFGEIEERARLKCVALIDEFRCCRSSSTRDLRKTDATALEIKCVTDLSSRGAGKKDRR